MTMVITPEIPRAKDAQDVGFRWVSFTRASPPKVGQFWMRANTLTATHLQLVDRDGTVLADYAPDQSSTPKAPSEVQANAASIIDDF